MSALRFGGYLQADGRLSRTAKTAATAGLSARGVLHWVESVTVIWSPDRSKATLRPHSHLGPTRDVQLLPRWPVIGSHPICSVCLRMLKREKLI